MAVVAMLGGPQPYLEALSNRLETNGHTPLVTNGHTPAGINGAVERHATVVYCDNLSGWQELAAAASMGAAIAVLAEFDPSHYAKALQQGCVPVHIDTSTDIIASVVEAALQSEVLLPLGVAQELASQWRTRSDLGHMTSLEEGLAQALIQGSTVQQIASSYSYSDRTIRRKLQGLYLKLGVGDRTGAIRALKAKGY